MTVSNSPNPYRVKFIPGYMQTWKLFFYCLNDYKVINCFSVKTIISCPIKTTRKGHMKLFLGSKIRGEKGKVVKKKAMKSILKYLK